MKEEERKEYLMRKISRPRTNQDDAQCCPVKTVIGNPSVTLSGEKKLHSC